MNFRLLVISLYALFAGTVFGQDTPCECGETGVEDCGGTSSFYTSEAAATSAAGGAGDANARHTFSSPIDISSAGTYQFCHSFTTNATQTSIAYRNFISQANINGGDWSRTYVVYDANDCATALTPTDLGNNFFEISGLSPNTEYNFCVDIVVTANVPTAEISATEFYLYDNSPPVAGPCAADAGSYVVTVDGVDVTDAGNAYYVENGQSFTITYQNDGTLPNAASADPTGIGYDIFSCAPTFDPSSELPADDPCYLGTAFDLSNNITDANSGDQSQSVAGRTELWFLPTTMDDMLKTSTGGANDDRGPDTDNDGCWDSHEAIHITYATPPTPPAECGTCSAPTCPIAHVSSFNDRSDGYYLGIDAACNEMGNVTNTTYVTYHTVTVDANGAVGLAQQLNLNINGCETRSVVLRPANDACNSGADILPDDPNVAGFGSGFNPEWYGLQANADYVVIVTTVLAAGCEMDRGCLVAYDIPNPPVPPAVVIPPCAMQNGRLDTCDCNFRDSGTETANYSANESYVYTICPETAGAQISINFTSMDIGANDILNIYDGDQATGQPIAALSNTTTTGSYTASTLSATGCLTFEWTSDGSGSNAGWESVISCISQCTNPIAAAAFDGQTTGPIRVCIGQTIDFDASSSTHNANSMDGYSWDLNDGTTTNTNVNFSHAYTQPGRYVPTLSVENDEGCTSTNAIDIEVLVGTEPNFVGINDTNTCPNTEVCFNSTVNFQTYTSVPQVPPTGTLNLPDGTGAPFQTTVTISGFDPGTTISSATDITNICLDMEHSAVDDITITLIAPSGERLVLHNRGGGATVLGNPVMDANAFQSGTCDWGYGSAPSGPGDAFTYCFNSGASETWKDHGDANWNFNCYQMPAGDYLPVDNYNNLFGADVNGTWTIEIEDVSGNDDGYLMGWTISFDPSLLPANSTFTPTLASATWSGAGIDANSGCVTPTVAGNYTYTIVDNFGCSFDTTVALSIDPAADATFDYSATSYCTAETDPVAQNIVTAGGSFSADAGLVLSNSLTGEIDLSSSTVGGPYNVTYTTSGACAGVYQFAISVTSLDDASFDYPQSAYCPDEMASATNVVTAGGTFSASAGIVFADDATGEIDFAASTFDGTTYSITYATTGVCANSSTFDVTLNPQDTADFTYDAIAYCITAADPIISPAVTGGGVFSSSVGLSLNANTGAIDLSNSIADSTYTITYTTTGNCNASATASVHIDAQPNGSWAGTSISNEDDPIDLVDLLDASATAGGTFVGTSVTNGIFDPAGLSGYFPLTYTVENGLCQVSYKDSIEVFGIPLITLPNAFTPNGDMLNDNFKPVGDLTDAREYDFKVYDRWGDLVFEGTDIGDAWDGTEDGVALLQGLYAYKLTYRLGSNEKIRVIGQVLLLR